MNNILKSCLVLFIISSVCVVALAYVNDITTKPIAQQQELKETEAYTELFPGATEFVKDEKQAPSDSIITGITTAYMDGELIGEIVRISQKGYGGDISMMVGIDTDCAVSAIKVLSHSETPGLGAYCSDQTFMAKYKGKTQLPLTVIKSGQPADNEIDAITSATITTVAVTDAVNTAYEWAVSEGGLN